MEYIKKEDLIEGEIYVFNDKFINKIQNGNLNIKFWISIPGKYFHKQPSINRTNNIKLATPEEKHWLESCITADKFITFEEAMKTFITEYYEYIGTIDNSFTKNKIYKCLNPNNLEKIANFIDDNGVKNGWCGINYQKFKPSTKEAYDDQFVVKEPEFILPKKWIVKITDDNLGILNNYRFKINPNRFFGDLPTKYGYNYMAEDGSGDSGSDCFDKITLQQFKKYVLKEETVKEVKVIESLPQFKIIESIITKVENNEGNQFFINDSVTPIDGNNKGSKCIIESFKRNKTNTSILAITNLHKGNGININNVEHYIEPKVEVEPEFILPEKWGIKFNNQWSILSKFKPFHDTYSGNANKTSFYKYNTINHKTDCEYSLGNYTEITFEQFKKYVLKEEQPIIIANSTKDMLDFKSKGVDSIVLPQETLLEKAKRLYPIG